VNVNLGYPSFEFHHVGVACADIRSEVARMAPLGYTVDGEEFTDLRQGVCGLFLIGQSPRLELLEPLSGAPGGVLAPWLLRGVKLYHLAYVVRGLADAVEHLRAKRGKLVVPPVPAVAFGGREIAFLMLPNQVLVELIASE
jgi:methylmalonyl-CoA/ethylmalonyl-CoA epimerase